MQQNQREELQEEYVWKYFSLSYFREREIKNVSTSLIEFVGRG